MKSLSHSNSVGVAPQKKLHDVNSDGSGANDVGALTVYPWTSRNDQIIYSDDDRIIIGGGGASALLIEADFLRGLSQPNCPTFGSSVLSSTQDFVIDCMEVWTFDGEDEE